MTTAENTIKVGDRWIYTAPTGREVLHTVTAVDVEPIHQHKPGPCARLVADEAGWSDKVMWPADILAVDWFRRAEQ